MLSIVVPVFNERPCVVPLVERIEAALAPLGADYEILFVDDGSTDGTLEEIEAVASRNERVLYLSFSRNFGHQIALYAGIDHARGDAIVTLDGDLQHPPELIPTLVEHWRRGYDVVYTVRTDNRGHAVKEFFSRVYYWLLRKLTGVEVPTGGADFRLIDRTVADALRACDERFVFIRGLIPWLGFRRKAVAYQAEPRFHGRTKYVVRKMIAFALDGVFSFSIVPLRVISLLGVGTTLLGLVYGAYTLWVRLFSDRAVSGWASLVVIVLVFSGTQLISLGILSEYVGRIYEEVKHRPRYVIARASPRLSSSRNRSE
ncbi:MAG: glycosyltransferase [Candidatus Dadabacteria bacterium]|nr:MAG: glycosyltransferase [Candidatus Dadabacteria bacterium]